MKNNKLTYILIPLVFVIWGWLIYNIFDMVNDSDEILIDEQIDSFKPESNFSETADIDFELIEINRDPFLGSVYKKKTPQNKKVVSKYKRPQVSWPRIKFLGKVGGPKNGNDIYIIQVSGQQYLLQKGETTQGITVVKGNELTITLKFEGQRKQFNK